MRIISSASTTGQYINSDIGSKMRIAGAEPNATDPNLRINFDCGCGFEYRMSERIAREIVRDHL